MDIALINENYPWIFTAVFFLLGACVGSFLNVCILRLPKGESIISPPSHCACGKPIKFYDNIPILSWLLLRGKARCCGRRISPRYFAVELLTAALFAFAWASNAPQTAAAGMVFISIMIFCAFVDIDTMMLPDFATIGGTATGAILSAMLPELHDIHLEEYPFAVSAVASLICSCAGILVGSGMLYWIRLLGQTVFRREAMGEGDVILIGCIGAFCGWQGALFAIFGGSLIGSLIMIPIFAITRLLKTDKAKKSKLAESENPEEIEGAIPFGPWLALGGILYFLFFREITDSYFQNFTAIFF